MNMTNPPKWSGASAPCASARANCVRSWCRPWNLNSLRRVPAFRYGIDTGNWARVDAALGRFSRREIFPEHDWSWPGGYPFRIDEDLIWDIAGAGGQALGLHAAGFEHVGLVEIDVDAAGTLLENKPGWPVIQADLKDVDLSAFEGVDLLAGGVPCQPFSAAGERRAEDDERDLFPEALSATAAAEGGDAGECHRTFSRAQRPLSAQDAFGADGAWI